MGKRTPPGGGLLNRGLLNRGLLNRADWYAAEADRGTGRTVPDAGGPFVCPRRAVRSERRAPPRRADDPSGPHRRSSGAAAESGGHGQLRSGGPVSDGRHVVLPRAAAAAGRLVDHGYEPAAVDVGELGQGRWRCPTVPEGTGITLPVGPLTLETAGTDGFGGDSSGDLPLPGQLPAGRGDRQCGHRSRPARPRPRPRPRRERTRLHQRRGTRTERRPARHPARLRRLRTARPFGRGVLGPGLARTSHV